MPTNVPIMPFIVLILLLLPVKLSSQQLKTLAFGLWLIGGLVLFWRGGMFLAQTGTQYSWAVEALVIVVAVIIGAAKGKFVLSKTSQKNIERLNNLVAPQRPIKVYSIRSWIIIALMALISISLTLFHTPDLLRGGVNLAIGMALVISSLAYAKSLGTQATRA